MQCTDSNRRTGVQFFRDGHIVNNLSVIAGESFVVECKRCEARRNRPNWFYLNGTTMSIISSCDKSNASVCTGDNNQTAVLNFTSFTASQSGTYRCTNLQMNSINITLS